MKDTEIHVGLPNKEIRDFLSKQSSADFYKKATNKPTDASMGYIDKRIFALRESISIALAEIKYLENLKAIDAMLAMIGYEEWDVSDLVQKSGDNCLSFIGTREEYDNLLKQLKK